MFQGTYVEAIRQALHDAMEADSRVCCLGEDIGAYGGAFRATEGLLARFGPDRVMDTPISEQAIAGSAIGLALMGQRAVAEFQFMDFALLASDLMVNFAAKAHWRWGASVPVVFRGPAGAGNGGGPFHSQSPEGHFLGSPGLKVVCPGTVRDAYSLLRAAIEDPDPVLFLEHKHLYRRLKDAWDEAPAARLGEAALRKDGRRAAILTYGAAQHTALEAVADLDVAVLTCAPSGPWTTARSRRWRSAPTASWCSRRPAGPTAPAPNWQRASRRPASPGWTPPCCASAVPTRPSPPAPPWKPPGCPAPPSSARRSNGCWPGD